MLKYGIKNAIPFPVCSSIVMFSASPKCSSKTPHCRQRDHISPVLASLHWSSVKNRADFKILLFVFKSLHGLVPAYISDLLILHSASRLLRSSDQLLLSVPCPQSKSRGDGAFFHFRCLTVEQFTPQC